MSKRTYNDISRLFTFIRNVTDHKREQLNYKVADVYRISNAVNIKHFLSGQNNGKDAANALMQWTDTTLQMQYNDKITPVDTIDDIVDYCRDFINEQIRTTKMTKVQAAEQLKVARSLFIRFTNFDSESVNIATKIMKRYGIKIICESPWNNEIGADIRHKRMMRFRKKKRTEAKLKEEYVSEYKKEIKERLKKLWP